MSQTSAQGRISVWPLEKGDLPTSVQIMQDARLTGLDENPVFRWILFRAKQTCAYPWGIVALVPCYYLSASLMLGALYDALPATWGTAAVLLMGILFIPTALQVRWLPNIADWGFRRYWGGLLNEHLLFELSQTGVTPASAALGCLGTLHAPRFIRAIRRTAQFFVFVLGGTAIFLSYAFPSDGYKLGLFFLCFQLGYLLHLIMFGNHLLLHRYADLFTAETRAICSGARRKWSAMDWIGLLLIAWIAVVLLGALSLALSSITLGSLSQVQGPVFLAAGVPGFVAGHVQGNLARVDQHLNVRKLEEAFKLLLGPRG